MIVWKKINATATLSLGTAALALCLGAGLLDGPARAQEAPSWHDMWDPAWTWREDAQNPDAKKDAEMRMRRHRKFMTEGVPKEFAEAHNPLGFEDHVIERGAELYGANCARCHGVKGLGDGAAAGDLSPSPALLSHLITRPIAVDPYLFWTISKGGVAFKTAMPAFEDTLQQDDIWSIVSYMRAGFPALDNANDSGMSEMDEGTADDIE